MSGTISSSSEIQIIILFQSDLILFKKKNSKQKCYTDPSDNQSILQWRIVTVKQSLVCAVAGPQWVTPKGRVFVVAILVIKFHTLLSDIHPLNYLTRGGKSQ